jgi:cell division protein FtsB
LGQVATTLVANHITSKARIRVERRTRNRRITDALILMVILAASAICFSFYWRTNAKLTVSQGKNQEMISRVESLRVQTEKLEREIDRLQHDPKLIEDYVRHHLGFVRAGDVIVSVETNSADAKKQNLTHQ